MATKARFELEKVVVSRNSRLNHLQSKGLGMKVNSITEAGIALHFIMLEDDDEVESQFQVDGTCLAEILGRTVIVNGKTVTITHQDGFTLTVRRVGANQLSFKER